MNGVDEFSYRFIALRRLDPVKLLQQIRAAQTKLAELSARGTAASEPRCAPDTDRFLASLSEAWKQGEVRATHRRKPTALRTWRTRADPFEHTWPTFRQWLESDPGVSAKDLLARLAVLVPELYTGHSPLQTLQRRVQAWRRERAMQLVFARSLRRWPPSPRSPSRRQRRAKPCFVVIDGRSGLVPASLERSHHRTRAAAAAERRLAATACAANCG
jgi:hypothetical protein